MEKNVNLIDLVKRHRVFDLKRWRRNSQERASEMSSEEGVSWIQSSWHQVAKQLNAYQNALTGLSETEVMSFLIREGCIVFLFSRFFIEFQGITYRRVCRWTLNCERPLLGCIDVDPGHQRFICLSVFLSSALSSSGVRVFSSVSSRWPFLIFLWGVAFFSY